LPAVFAVDGSSHTGPHTARSRRLSDPGCSHFVRGPSRFPVSRRRGRSRGRKSRGDRNPHSLRLRVDCTHKPGCAPPTAETGLSYVASRPLPAVCRRRLNTPHPAPVEN